jgi:hypothetical protein
MFPARLPETTQPSRLRPVLVPKVVPLPGSGRESQSSAAGEELSGYPLWLWPNLLSLDAPLVAVLWLKLFALSAGIHVRALTAAVLALTVWLIYAADRLLDGLSARSYSDLSPRHRFSVRSRNVLICFCLAALVAASSLCFELSRTLLLLGAGLFSLVVLYFGCVHLWPSTRSRFPKELVVAIVFGVGTVLPVLSKAGVQHHGRAVSLALFVALCWLNVVLIEYAEWMNSPSGRKPHVSTIIGGKHIAAISAAVMVASLGLAATFAMNSVMLAAAFSALGLAALGYWWRKLSINFTRVLADVTLLTPALFLPFVHR